METNKRLDKLFFALADPRRRAILEELSEEKKTVGDLAENFNLSLGAISKHLSLMEAAELIYKTKQGRKVYCHMNLDTWKELARYISMQAKFWGSRLDELEQFINTRGES